MDVLWKNSLKQWSILIIFYVSFIFSICQFKCYVIVSQLDSFESVWALFLSFKNRAEDCVVCDYCNLLQSTKNVDRQLKSPQCESILIVFILILWYRVCTWQLRVHHLIGRSVHSYSSIIKGSPFFQSG